MWWCTYEGVGQEVLLGGKNWRAHFSTRVVPGVAPTGWLAGWLADWLETSWHTKQGDERQLRFVVRIVINTTTKKKNKPRQKAPLHIAISTTTTTVRFPFCISVCTISKETEPEWGGGGNGSEGGVYVCAREGKYRSIFRIPPGVRVVLATNDVEEKKNGRWRDDGILVSNGESFPVS